MKRKRRLFGILLIITALIIMQLPVSEADAATSASDFKIEGSTLVEYRGTDKTVSIPDTVKVIATDAFLNNTDVELVSVPDSVTKIEEYAFWGCDNLESIVLGTGMTEIGDYAFANCKGLTKMSVPSCIRSIGIQAFADCVNLSEITIRPQTLDIHETAFDGCYKLTINCEKGSYAEKYAEEFYERQKEMPEYEDIEDYDPNPDKAEDSEDTISDTTASSGQSDGELIGDTRVVGNHAFVFVDNTSLEVFSGNVTHTPGVMEESLMEGTIDSIDSLAKYTIIDGSVVADQAYYCNKELQDVILPDGIKEIGQFAFARSTVTKLVLPEGVSSIGYGAFYHCDNLTEVELPETIENVEPNAFAYTPWVQDFMENGESDFLISGDVLVAYRGSSSIVNIPEGVRVIAAQVFSGHQEIREVVLPDTLLVVGEAAFENCSDLSVVICGEQVQQIKDRAFSGCKLEKVTLPETVTGVGIGAFDKDVVLVYEGVIPDVTHEVSAERLSNEAYRNCSEEQGEPGVAVEGDVLARATLEGAARSYKLSVTEADNTEDFEKAYLRALRELLPEETLIYDILLTDNSGIPIRKLGKQLLELTVPLTEGQAERNLQVFTTDRNGQLELVEHVRVRVDGQECLRVSLDYISQLAIVKSDNIYDGIPVIEETTEIVHLAQGPLQKLSNVKYHWILGCVLLATGLLCIVWRKR